jgi:hypothetical protein
MRFRKAIAESRAGLLMQILRKLRGAPRSNPAQQRHVEGETVSHAGFIALLRAKAPKLNGLA